jgi:hypothetical protein
VSTADPKLIAEQTRKRAQAAGDMVRDLRRMLGEAMQAELELQKAAREAERAVVR